MRANGKWYNLSDEEITFEIKYFMNMELLDKLDEILDKVKESE